MFWKQENGDSTDSQFARGREKRAIGAGRKNQNQQVEPEHLLASMVEQKEGTLADARQDRRQRGNDPDPTFCAAIARFPQVSGGQQYFSSRINTIFQRGSQRPPNRCRTSMSRPSICQRDRR
ncbi:MAG: hypothetical protein IPJ30_28030 [Acidobacteria bacterium]|nr:hypothetical protein [Acidobacteriota bacterium]